LVMQHLGALRFCLEPRANSNDNGHVSLLCHAGVVGGVRG
jgi:hypothetical protein